MTTALLITTFTCLLAVPLSAQLPDAPWTEVDWIASFYGTLKHDGELLRGELAKRDRFVYIGPDKQWYTRPLSNVRRLVDRLLSADALEIPEFRMDSGTFRQLLIAREPLPRDFLQEFQDARARGHKDADSIVRFLQKRHTDHALAMLKDDDRTLDFLANEIRRIQRREHSELVRGRQTRPARDDFARNARDQIMGVWRQSYAGNWPDMVVRVEKSGGGYVGVLVEPNNDQKNFRVPPGTVVWKITSSDSVTQFGVKVGGKLYATDKELSWPKTESLLTLDGDNLHIKGQHHTTWKRSR